MGPINEANVQAQPGKRLEETEKKKGGKGWRAAIGIIVAAAVVFYGACCMLAHTSKAFFPHTYINGVEVSGSSRDAAVQTVNTALRERTVDLTLEGESAPFATIPMADLLADQPVDPASVAAVYDRQHSGLFSGGWQYMKHLFSRSHESLAYQWDESGLDSRAQEAAQQVYRAPQDTSAEIDDGQLAISVAEDGRQVSADTVRSLLLSVTGASGADPYNFTLQPEVLPAKALTAQEIHSQVYGVSRNASYDAATDTIVPEQMGADFDVAAAQAALDAAQPGETVTVPAQLQAPEVTAEQLSAVLFRDVLGEAKTHVSGSAGRIGNVKLSAKTINGLVLNSGDTFSYNESVGKRTAERGYQAAPAYVKGETVDEIGGGICQTSSTLYLACLLANMEITERYAHRYVPAYITWGMDATVSWGGPDYRFTNDTLYPVKIVTSYDKGYLTVKLLGTNTDGSYVKMTNEVLSKTPWETVYQEDPTMAPGAPEVVKVTPYTGYKVKTYQTIYNADGTVRDSHFEASSDYKVRNKVILRAPGSADVPTTGPSADVPADTPAGSGDAPADTGTAGGGEPGVPAVPAEPAAPAEGAAPAEP